MKKSTAVVLAAAAMLAGTALTTLPAQADLVTRCSGTAGAVTVPGDLVVPRGASCTLTGTVVEGDVRVRPGADLIATGVSVTGQVIGTDGAYVELVESEVGGQVRLTGSYGGVLDGSTVSDRLLVRASSAGDESGAYSFVYASEASLGGNVVVRTGETVISSSTVGGSITSQGATYTDVYDTFVDRRLEVIDSAEGSMVCAVVVQREGHFSDNAGAVQLGADGPGADCTAGTSYWGGDLTVQGSTGGVVIDDNIVNGSLHLADNEPTAQVGANNRVRGQVEGLFAPLETAGPSTRALRSQAADDRAAQVQERISERRVSATQRAAAAGSADLG